MSTNGNGHSEAPASATAKWQSPRGAYWLITRRNETMSKLVDELEQLEQVLTARGWQPVAERGSGRKGPPAIAAPADGSAPTCPAHQVKMRPSSYGGWYCTRKDDAGNYCKHKAR